MLRGRIAAGRHQVALVDHHGQRREMLVHRLVLLAFVGPCPEGMEACHEDDDPTNNRLGNLRWDTRASNVEDRIRNGRQTWAKLDAETVEVLRHERSEAGTPYRVMAERLGVTRKAVSHACRGITYKHAGGPVAR